jgi:hypothetical protein
MAESESGPQLSYEERWDAQLTSSSARLADDVSATVLVEEFPNLTDEEIDQLCNDAALEAIDDNASLISLSHFQSAFAKLGDGEDSDSEPRPDETVDDEQPPQPEIYDDNNDAVSAADTSNQEPDADPSQPDGSATDSTQSQKSQDNTDPSQSDGPKNTDGDRPDPSSMPRDELEAELEALRGRVDEAESAAEEAMALAEAVRRQLHQQSQLLVGEKTVQAAGITPDNVENHHQRLHDIDQRLEEQGDQLTMVRVDGGGSPDDPDARAQRIRQTLYNKAKQSDGQATMDRDDVDSRLGGGLHRDTVLGAMKRAADGYDAELDEQSYTAINGSSDLQPVDSIGFVVGDGRGTSSKVVMNLSNATGAEIRQNLTTDSAEEEA